MAPEYYALIESYARQDQAVLITFILAMLVLAGWLVIRRFGFRWLEQIYIGQLLVIYAALLAILGFAL